MRRFLVGVRIAGRDHAESALACDFRADVACSGLQQALRLPRQGLTGVLVLIRAGQVSFGNARFTYLAGYCAALRARAGTGCLILISLSSVLAALAGPA